LSAFLLVKPRLAFLDVTLSLLIFFWKAIQKSDCYWALA